MKQRTDEWHEARRGKLTASRMHRLMSDNLGTIQKLFEALRGEIEAGPGGWLEGRAYSNDAIVWGNEKEPHALAMYERQFKTPVQPVGILFHRELDYVGASPDGMIDGGSVEVKCPYNVAVHEKTLSHGMPRRHLCQVQSQSFVTGLPFVDFVSYQPLFKDERQLFVQRIPADPEYHRKLRTRCEWFWEALQRKEEITLVPLLG